MGKSAAFLDLGYTHSDQPRRPRGVSSIPVHHPKEPADRSPAAAALRAMRRQLDHADGRLTDGARAGDDPFARRQLMDAYERLKSAMAVYNAFAADLDVPEARVLIGDTWLESPIARLAPRQNVPVEPQIRPATGSERVREGQRDPMDVDAVQLARVEAARAAFFAKGRAE